MSAEPDRLTPAEHELEAALGGLAPAAHQIDRDALMFRLGRESTTAARRRWQMAAAALLLVTLTTWGWSMHRRRSSPGPQPTPPGMVAERQPTPPPPVPERTPDPAGRQPGPRPSVTSIARAPGPTEAYLNLRNLVLAHGVDALPESTIAWQPDVEPIVDWPADQRPPSLWLRRRPGMPQGDAS